jgi:hypothetical protein
VEINPLMSFKHLRMLNSASKCFKITLKVIKIFKTRKNISPKNSSCWVISGPLESFEGGGGGTYPPSGSNPGPCMVDTGVFPF